MPASLPEFISRSVVRGRYIFFRPRTTGRAATAPPLVCAGWEECSTDYAIDRPGFPHPALEFITSGRWELRSGRGVSMLGPGSIFTYGRNTPYRLCPVAAPPFSKYFIDFAGAAQASALRRAGLTPLVPAQVHGLRWLQDLLDQIVDLAHIRPSSRLPLCSRLVDAFLIRLREEGHRPEGDEVSAASFERCRSYMAANYLRSGRLSEVAKACGVSQVHLCRLFRRYAGQSPRQHLVSLKMNHAAERLRRARVPVKAAAAEVGYDDPFHFSRLFKSVHGVPPSRFASGR